MITLHCCGEDYYADEMHIGSHIRCRKCARFLTIEPKTPSASMPPRKANVRRAWSRLRLLPVKPVFGAVLVIALAVGMSHPRFANRNEQFPGVSEAQMPAPAKAQPNAPSPSPNWVPERVPVSLRTGTWITRPHGIAGRGVLTIENGSGLDAVVKLVTTNPQRKTVWKLYVRAHEQKSVPGIAVGSYLLRFALGLDWDADTRKFLRNTEFYQAGKTLEFTEIEPTVGRTGNYTEIEITLHEMFGGNLQREPINEIMFDEGDLN